MGTFGKQISRCVFCGRKIDKGGDTSSLAVHFVCAAWLYSETKFLNGGKIKDRTYSQTTLPDQLFHHEMVSAIGHMVQERGIESVATQLQISPKQIYSILSLNRSIPENAIEALGYRKMPIYVKDGTLSWPMDLVDKSGNARRMV